MASINKTCLTCKGNYEVFDADQSFYQRVSAPVPKYCPPCRMQRRIAHRNERTLYRRVCDLCKKEGVSIYPAGTPWPVYCAPCWWSDGWSAKSFAMDYDPSRPFLDQWQELQAKVPRIALLCLTSVNSEYTNNAGDNKNCYLIFAAEQNEDSMYSRLIMHCKSCVDCAWVYDSELCYECVDCRGCFKCMYSERCQKSTDLLFCFDVRDSQNCILSVNLRHKQYCIENVQYTKEEFEKKKKEILASRESIEAAKKRYAQLRGQALVKYAFQTKCVDATGDYMFNCHEGRLLFDTTSAKACKYLADAEEPIDCYDMNNAYYKPELCVDIMGVLQINNCKYSSYIFYSNELEYCDSCHNSNSCFGCIGMTKVNNCILNKQYSKEEYQKLRAQIIESMKKDGTYGDFLPPNLSPFGYNETLAKDFFALTKEEALARGFKWQDNISTGTVGKENGKDIFACADCSRNFRITPAELQFYQQMQVPLPTKDFECRHRDRMAKRTPRRLWHRSCQCKIGHDHADKPCANEFETAYAPDRKEVIYCEPCYQAEVV